jgi:hypothetical protein
MAYESHNAYLAAKKVEVRKNAIRRGSKEVFQNCPDISTFDLRRACFKNKMIEMKKSNPYFKTKYDMIIGNKITKVSTEDLGDLLKIQKPKMGFLRCISNTFFFDWVGENVYISMENPLGSVECINTDKEKVSFIPSGLSKEEISILKREFSKPIE